MESAMPTALETPYLEGSDCDPLKLNNGMPNGLAHAPYLTVPPFADRDLKNSRPKLRHPSGKGDSIIKVNAFTESA
jgi:hypothetical protein